MNQGYLSDYFDGVASKILTTVEADLNRSNQHEFQGVAKLRTLFGTPTDKIRYPANFIYMTDDEPVMDEGFVTWSDVRRGNPNRSPEYHLYYSTTEVSKRMMPSDLMVIAKCKDGSVLVIVAEPESTSANQILWLFNIDKENNDRFSIRKGAELETEQYRLSYTSGIILETVGIEVNDTDESYLEEMLGLFDGKFPKTKEFSDYARKTLREMTPFDNPDDILLAWMDREEILFRTLERHFITEHVQEWQRKTAAIDVDEFIKFSLSVQNRRKSRAGLALENHVEAIFTSMKIAYERNASTENKSRPDFLFPGRVEYFDDQFPNTHLTMLGVKSTCKDRWRQVLTEAKRIENKHLLTLQPAISINQTEEMKNNHLQLVVPQSLHNSYNPEQQSWLMSFENFIDLVKSRHK